MEIKVLSSDVVDQIAAGEVVERPSHLLKELLENSLDAGATQIEVDVDLGGKKIRVSDNGSGISREDLPLVCARHATSKISAADDLWKLRTFGFRGEALASISSVSRLKVTSKHKNFDQAFCLLNEFGRDSEPVLSGRDIGTTVEVDDLFLNVPARLKFLKSDSAEVTQMKNVVKALALANPRVEFKFKQAGKVVLFYPREKDLRGRAEKVLDVPQLFWVEKEHQGFRVEIVYGSPNVTTGNSKQIWIFVQDRWVQDRTVQAGVMEAYRSLLMHGEFPFVVVKVLAPTDSVDVNIHPTKSQVKFIDTSFIFRLVHSALRAELERAPWLGVLDQPERGAPPPSLSMPVDEPKNMSFSSPELDTTRYFQKKFYSTPSAAASVETSRDDVLASWARSSAAPTSSLGVSLENPADAEAAAPVSSAFWSSLQVIGQTYLTYILAEGDHSLFLIDQHAAHERVVYERLMANWKDGKFEVQSFLLPVSLELPADQVDMFVGLVEEFKKMGLEIERGGPETLLVSSSPSFISEKALVKSLEKFGDELSRLGGSFSFEKKVSDIFATMACHSVVRAGQSLSVEEMRSLLEQMDEFRLSSYCPHGRNVYLELPLHKIEKDFGRLG